MSDCYEKCRPSCFNIVISFILSLLFLAVATLAILFVVTNRPANLTGIQAELVGAGGTIYPDGGNVVFDTLVNNQSADINYNGATGAFTITAPGNYYVDWWVGTDGAGPSTSVSFAIEVNGVLYSESSSPIVSGQLSGEALVTVTSVPVTITLVNVTSQDAFVPVTPTQAGIVITRVINQ